jgi:uncharacterized protein YbaR (Trm112 family)
MGDIMAEHTESRRPVNIDKDLLAILCCPDTKQDVKLADETLIAKLNEAVGRGQLKNRADQRRPEDTVPYPRRYSRHAHRRRHSSGRNDLAGKPTSFSFSSLSFAYPNPNISFHVTSWYDSLCLIVLKRQQQAREAYVLSVFDPVDVPQC